MLSAAAYALLYTTPWMDPIKVGKLFVVPDTVINNTKQNTHIQMCQAIKDLQEKFNNYQMALKTMPDCIIEPAYHSARMV